VIREKGETMTKKIFIGSSLEAKRTVDLLKTEIENVLGIGSVLPWDESFEQGVLTLAAIETLPNKVVGALILATPDVTCTRVNRPPSREPVSNVVYEYGYLSARLSGLNDHRVAICRFDGVTLPTDLAGLATIMAGPYDTESPPPLSDQATKQLRDWLNRLVPLAEGIPPIGRVHGYSGTWDIETRFHKFRGVDLDPSDNVYFKGRMFLFLSADGKGTGRQEGETSVTVGDYNTTFRVESQLDATLDGQGNLKLVVHVLNSTRGKERGKPRDPSLREPLPGHKKFSVKLKPKLGEPRTLIGEHEYSPGFRELQLAKEEKYTYLGFYYP
jgi:hypothetical protein